MLQVAIEEVEQGFFGRLFVVPLEAVAGPLQGDELCFDGGGFQPLDDPLSLFVGDVFVLGSVHAQSRSRRRA